MWIRAILFAVCLQVMFLKAVRSHCIGTPVIAVESLLPLNMALDKSTPVIGRIIGGNLIIDTSAAEPSGVSIFSDDIYIDGTVLVMGNLPFSGTVALEGIVPATGSSTVAYECGNGNVDITSKPLVPVSAVQPNVPSLGLAGSVNRLS